MLVEGLNEPGRCTNEEIVGNFDEYDRDEEVQCERAKRSTSLRDESTITTKP